MKPLGLRFQGFQHLSWFHIWIETGCGTQFQPRFHTSMNLEPVHSKLKPNPYNNSESETEMKSQTKAELETKRYHLERALDRLAVYEKPIVINRENPCGPDERLLAVRNASQAWAHQIRQRLIEINGDLSLLS